MLFDVVLDIPLSSPLNSHTFLKRVWLLNSECCKLLETMSKFKLNSFKRDKIKLKSGLNKKQADVALLLAHNQGKISCACTVHDTHLYLIRKTQHVTCLTYLSAVVLFVNCQLSCLKCM